MAADVPFLYLAASCQSKSKKKNKPNAEIRVRKWTEKELKEFAYVLADDIDDFAYKLESLALKKSANQHIFEKIKEEFDARLRRTLNEDQDPSEEKGNNTPIDTSIVKLRNKYKWLKDQWRKITDKAKTGSGQAAKNDPEWYTILDPVFNETNTKLKLASQANDILSSDSNSEESEECDSTEEQTLRNKHSLSPTADLEAETTNKRVRKYTVSEDNNSLQADSNSDSSDKRNKLKSSSSLMVPRKRKKVTTQAEALSQLSSSLVSLGESQKGRMEMWLMAEQRREESYLQYQEKQAELNRQHELRMVQLMTSLQNRGNYLTQGIQHQNSGQNGWSMMNEQAFSTVSYHPPEMGTSNGEPVYTNLDNYNK